MDEPAPTGPSSPESTPREGGPTEGSVVSQGVQQRVASGHPSTSTVPTSDAPRKRRRAWVVATIVVAALVLGGFGACALAWRYADLGDLFPMGDAVAVIHIDGVIAGTGSSLEGIISPESFLDALDGALSDPSVKAIVLRIDSPGGTVAASQEIAIEVGRADMPIVASIGDVGASGAYMVASQCDEIVAIPTSAVGSIGVISEIPNVAGLLDKLGIEYTVLTAGEFKDAGSPFRSLTPSETALIQREVDIAYDEFIRLVAEGRDLPEDDVRDMATGWAWSAIEAEDMGLVDTLGTFEDALDVAAELGGIDGEPQVVYYDQDTPGDFLSTLLDIKKAMENLDSLTSGARGVRPSVPR